IRRPILADACRGQNARWYLRDSCCLTEGWSCLYPMPKQIDLASLSLFFFFKQKTAYEIGLGIPAEPLFRSPLKDIRDEYNYPKKKGIKDECSRLLEASTMKSRRGFAIQRLMNAMRQAHADGWFIVFDTLTLADDRLEAFYDNPNALR